MRQGAELFGSREGSRAILRLPGARSGVWVSHAERDGVGVVSNLPSHQSPETRVAALSNPSAYWDEEVETMSRDALAHLQHVRLRHQLRRCFDGSTFYRAKLEDAGIQDGDLADLVEPSRV